MCESIIQNNPPIDALSSVTPINKIVTIEAKQTESDGTASDEVYSHSLDFDASQYAYCTVVGTVKVIYYTNNGNLNTYHNFDDITGDELIYNVDGPIHKYTGGYSGTAAYQGCWFRYTSSEFIICAEDTLDNYSAIRQYIEKSNLTAIFHN